MGLIAQIFVVFGLVLLAASFVVGCLEGVQTSSSSRHQATNNLIRDLAYRCSGALRRQLAHKSLSLN